MKPRKDEDWHRLHAGRPLDPLESLPRDALIEWLRFEIECETFDRAIPGFWLPNARDEWMPYDGALSRRFAREKRLDAEAKLRSVGYSLDMWTEARRYAAGLSFERQKELLAHLLATDPRGSVPR